MIAKITTIASVIVFVGSTSACSQRTVPEQEFGAAVRSVMNSQIHDYEAAIHPNPNAVEGSDPGRLNNVLETYREHVSQPEEVRQPISINVGTD